MSRLKTVTSTFRPYIPGQYDEHLDSSDELLEEEIEDYRYYEVIEGIKVALHHHVKILYENGVIQCEGTYLDGYKEGIWRFFNENGVLSSVGSYNKRNQRWGKWRLYEELNGKACIRMISEQRTNSEEYWSYDMDGKLCSHFKILNTLGPIDDHIYETGFYEPSDRDWPGSDHSWF